MTAAVPEPAASASAANGVVLKDIRKSYGKTEVLPPLSLAIGRGELLALLGPSGCGKTTTLRIIAGLERADAGTVEIEGTDVTGLPPERRGLGMVFQHYAVWPHRSVAANVAYPLERAKSPKAETAARVKEALSLVHLDALAERRPHQLSGGQLQRVALARALVARPRVLLLDEPLSNLDALLREEMRAEIRGLQRQLGMTTVLVTHDQEEALAIADRIAVLNAGRIEQLGTPSDVYRTPATAFVAGFVGGGNVLPAECDGRVVRAGPASVPAPAGGPSGSVHLVVRPEEIRLDPAGFALPVLERLYLGDRVELRLDCAGTTIRAMVPANASEAAQPGARASFSFGAVTVLPR